MPLIYNGTTVKKVIYNGTDLKQVIYNGVVVFTAYDEIYKNGVLMDGVTLTGNFINADNQLSLDAKARGQSVDTKDGGITFDFTKYTSITVKGTVDGWVRTGSAQARVGIDDIDTYGSYEFLFNDDNLMEYDWSENFERTYDTSALSGTHSYLGRTHVGNSSNDQIAYSNSAIRITEIIGNV